MIPEFALFVYTSLAGLAGGLYAADAVFSKMARIDAAARFRRWVIPLVALLLLAISGAALLLHLGRPERVLLAFSNPIAGIAQEGYATIAFGLAVVVDFIVSLARRKAVYAPRVVVALLGLALSIVMAVAYFSYDTQTAWSTWQTFPLFVIGNLLLGYAAYWLFAQTTQWGNRGFLVFAVFAVLYAITAVAEIIHYSSVAPAGVPVMVVGLCAIAVSLACLLLAKRKGSRFRTLYVTALTCAIVSILLIRYGFYMAYLG